MKIKTTKDYSLFKPIDGNRAVNKLHLKRLTKKIEKRLLYTIITVNENYEIIDGQHRFYALKELNHPINYIVIDGYSLNEVHIYNENNKNWNTTDYIEGYSNLGYIYYKLYKEFKEKYGFCFRVNQFLLTGSQKNITEQFKAGEFKVKDYKKAIGLAEKIKEYAKYYDGADRRSFQLAIINLLNSDKFSHDIFIRKLKINPTQLEHLPTINQYIDRIEQIYNYKNKNKVNLRYL